MTEQPPQRGRETHVTPETDRNKRGQMLFGKANKAIAVIGKQVENLQGTAEKVADKKRGIVSESTRILYTFTRKTLVAIAKVEVDKTLSKTAKRLKVAKLLKHHSDTIALWMDPEKSPVLEMLARKRKTYEDVAKIRDEFVGVTEIMQDKQLSKIYVKVAKGTPLSDAELDYVVSKVSAGKLEAKAQKEGVGDKPRKYLQVAMGPILHRMKFRQKVNFADKFVRQKGATEFLQLAQIMLVSGGLSAGQYRDLLNILVRRKFNLRERDILKRENIRAHDPNYQAKIIEKAQLFRKTYRKIARDMKIDYHENAIDKTLTAGNIARVIGTLWGGTVMAFNALASFTQTEGTIPEKLASVGTNPYFLLGAGGTYLAVTSGVDSSEKYDPKRPKNPEKAKTVSEKGLIDIYENNPELHDFLANNGMKAIIKFNRENFHATKLSKEGINPDSTTGQIKTNKGPLAKINTKLLLKYLREKRPVNNSGDLSRQLERLANRAVFKGRLDKQLSTALTSTVDARITNQDAYDRFVKNYRDNRDKYPT